MSSYNYINYEGNEESASAGDLYNEELRTTLESELESLEADLRVETDASIRAALEEAIRKKKGEIRKIS